MSSNMMKLSLALGASHVTAVQVGCSGFKWLSCGNNEEKQQQKQHNKATQEFIKQCNKSGTIHDQQSHAPLVEVTVLCPIC